MEKRQIKDKLDITVIDGQSNCGDDCVRSYWDGANAWENLVHNSCSKKFTVMQSFRQDINEVWGGESL